MEPFAEEVLAVWERERAGLYGYALSLTGREERAEELVQECIARLLFRGRLPREPRPYLFRMIRNAAVDGWRSGPSGGDGPAVEPDDGGSAALRSLRDVMLAQALARLDPPQREVLILKLWGGLTFREIGEVLAVSLNTAASRYRRGLERLRGILEGNDGRS